ncbi:MAG: argininosuccinate lyase, partial [Bacteroidales bacterium]|nr:argininosuccinate lyase [Bacteroidales bacterium]
HTGRSRNDQVLVAIRMFEKDQLDEIVRQLKDLITALDQFISDFGDYPLPGYTHTRKAMPYTVGEWINALKFGLTQDCQMIEETRKLIDLNPLGTGAGYGVPFQLDREITTKLLGFSETLENSLYAQNSRGKLESRILHDCLMILYDLNRWSSDLIFFTLPELGYFVLNQAHTTGSSVMPHKKNPDVLELIRASAGIVRGYEQQSFTLPLNLISGYHRDLQWTKEPVIRGTDLTILAIQAAAEVIKGLKPEPEVLKESMTDELKSVEEIKKLVEQGIPFRDAYRIISKKFHL